MVRAHLLRMRGALVSALGITILLGTPLLAQADQGKWWKPKEGDRSVQTRDRGNQGAPQQGDRGGRGGWAGRGQAGGAWQGPGAGNRGGWAGRGQAGGAWQGPGAGNRGGWAGRGQAGGAWQGPGGRGGWAGRGQAGGAWRGPAGGGWAGRGQAGGDVRFRGRVQGGPGWSGGNIAYRDRGLSGRASWGGSSTWRGVPVRRDVLTIRDRRYGGGLFRARRLYCAPRYYGRFVYVRPVRYYIGADALIGGFGIHARIVRPHYVYACNFCDEQFDSYEAYAAHVEHCHYRPSGLQISVSNWDDDYGATWDGPYPADDGYNSYQDNGAYDDQGYDPNDQGYDQNGPGDNYNDQGGDQGDNGYNDQ
jgi:hypothetical protein